MEIFAFIITGFAVFGAFSLVLIIAKLIKKLIMKLKDKKERK